MKLNKKDLSQLETIFDSMVVDYDDEENTLSIDLCDGFGHSWLSVESLELKNYETMDELKEYLYDYFCQSNLDDELEFLIKERIPGKPNVITLVDTYRNLTDVLENIEWWLL